MTPLALPYLAARSAAGLTREHAAGLDTAQTGSVDCRHHCWHNGLCIEPPRMRSPGNPRPGVPAPWNAAEGAFAFLGLRSGSGERVMPLNGGTGRYTRAGNPPGLRPRRWYGDRTQGLSDCGKRH